MVREKRTGTVLVAVFGKGFTDPRTHMLADFRRQPHTTRPELKGYKGQEP